MSIGQSITQYRQNRLYELIQKRLLNKLEGTQGESAIPDKEESRRFWSGRWDQALVKTHGVKTLTEENRK